MSESRDEGTGQFTSDEPLYGLAGVERDAGYVHLPDETKEEPEELTVAEAAERYDARSTPESNIKTYSGIRELDDNVALTVEQAHKLITDEQEADQAQAELEEADKIRKEVDELRGVKPEAKDAKDEPADAETSVEKFWKIPEVKEAVQKVHAENEQVKQTYSKAVDIANDFARASFIENFPEIAALPLEHWEGALAAMSQREPERFNRATASLNRVMQLQAAQQQQQQQREFAERQQFETFSKAENERFETMIKSEPKETRRAVESAIVEAIKEYGGDSAEFFELFKSTKLLNSAVAQRILYDAGKYRMIQKAKTAVAAKPVPHVQRPGVARPASERSGGDDLSALSSRLDKTGDIKDAMALYEARQRRANRG